MESTEVVFDLERSKKIYKKYFTYEMKRGFKSFPYLMYYGTGLVLCVIGGYFNIDFWGFLGLGMICLISLFLLFHFLKNKILFSIFLNTLEKKMIESEREFLYSFDENGLKHESKNFNQTINWEMIGCFRENDGDIYLYFTNEELHNIISVSILGQEKYEKFKQILEGKVKAGK